MSALIPKADSLPQSQDVHFVPKADIDAITPIKPQTNNKEAANRGGLFLQSAGGV